MHVITRETPRYVDVQPDKRRYLSSMCRLLLQTKSNIRSHVYRTAYGNNPTLLNNSTDSAFSKGIKTHVLLNPQWVPWQEHHQVDGTMEHCDKFWRASATNLPLAMFLVRWWNSENMHSHPGFCTSPQILLSMAPKQGHANGTSCDGEKQEGNTINHNKLTAVLVFAVPTLWFFSGFWIIFKGDWSHRRDTPFAQWP